MYLTEHGWANIPLHSVSDYTKDRSKDNMQEKRFLIKPDLIRVFFAR